MCHRTLETYLGFIFEEREFWRVTLLLYIFRLLFYPTSLRYYFMLLLAGNVSTVSRKDRYDLKPLSLDLVYDRILRDK